MAGRATPEVDFRPQQGGKVGRHVTDDVLTIFRTYDKDSSGSIDLDELSTALSDLKLSASTREIVEIMQRYDADQSGTLELTEFGQLVHDLRRFQATQAVSKHQAELHRSYGMLEMALPASERFELRVAAPGATPGKVASVEQFDPAGQPCIFETKAAPSASKEDPNHMAMVSMLLAPLSQALTLRVEVALLVNNGGKHWAAGLATLDIIRYEVRHTRLDLPALNASCTWLALRMATRGCFNCSRTCWSTTQPCASAA